MTSRIKKGGEDEIAAIDRELHEAESEILECIEARGPWPFLTRKVYRDARQEVQVWESRAHRKRLRTEGERVEVLAGDLWRCLWAPGDLNWWIGGIFAFGSLLFALGSFLSVVPSLGQAWGLSPETINAIYFLGSVPFTTAAYLQLYQSANAPPFGSVIRRSETTRRWLFGWKPRNIGWLSSVLQFVGTLLFNFDTFDAMRSGRSWQGQDVFIWMPDFLGSVFFLVSGYLAFIEVCHAHWAWRPSSLSWWVTWINLLGCIGFMISAVFAVVLPGVDPERAVVLATIANGFTLQGAICFFLGAILLWPEAARKSGT